MLFPTKIILVASSILAQCSNCEIIEVPDYWPEIGHDLTKVIWSHATNSRQKLEAALNGDTMMIEADVNLGFLIGSLDLRPIMAHPPTMVSDLSLELFLDLIIDALQTNPALRKGIKLDFKKTDILRDSLVIVQSKLGQLNCPLWINADIVEGPEWMQGLSSMKIVDANVFLSLLDELVPQATVSPGFTTSGSASNAFYSMAQIEAMLAVLGANGYLDSGKRITFPIRGIFAAQSYFALEYLLEKSSTDRINSTLTIWGTDKISMEELESLKGFIATIGKHRCYVDTAYDLLQRIFPNFLVTLIHEMIRLFT